MNGPLKINLVFGQQSVFPPVRGGGVENLNWMLAREYARLGHQVTAYSRKVPEFPECETDLHGIRHVRIPGYDLHPNVWRDHLNALKWTRRLISTMEPADVSTFHTAFSFIMRRWRRLGVCTHTIHRTPKWIVKLYRKMDRVYAGSDAVVRQAQVVDSKIKNLRRVYNCITIPHGAEPPPAVPKPEDAGLAFLYIGRFVRDKGLESFVKGFEIAAENFPANRLLTVGAQNDGGGADSAFFAQMSDYVRAKGMGATVEFMPPIYDKEKLNALIESADVICVPSLTGETFSMAVLEAMALAKPILVSDFGPMPEAVDHKVNGWVARTDDAASIAEGMEFFSRNPETVRQMGCAAFLKARDNFSAEVIAQEYLRDFRELIDRRAAR